MTQTKDTRDPNKPTRREGDVFCPVHETNTTTISETKGMVKVLIGIVTAFALSMSGMCGTMLYVTLVLKSDVSAYIASDSEQNLAMRRDIDRNRDRSLNLTERVSVLDDHSRDQRRELDETKKRVEKIERKVFP